MARAACDIEILPRGACDLEMMRDLGALAAELEAAELPATSTRADLPGVKDGGLSVGIALAGLALTAISTLVGTLTYWQSRKPKYEVIMKCGQATFTLSGLDKEAVRTAASQLKAGAATADVVVNVVKR